MRGAVDKLVPFMWIAYEIQGLRFHKFVTLSFIFKYLFKI